MAIKKILKEYYNNKYPVKCVGYFVGLCKRYSQGTSNLIVSNFDTNGLGNSKYPFKLKKETTTKAYRVLFLNKTDAINFNEKFDKGYDPVVSSSYCIAVRIDNNADIPCYMDVKTLLNDKDTPSYILDRINNSEIEPNPFEPDSVKLLSFTEKETLVKSLFDKIENIANKHNMELLNPPKYYMHKHDIEISTLTLKALNKGIYKELNDLAADAGKLYQKYDVSQIFSIVMPEKHYAEKYFNYNLTRNSFPGYFFSSTNNAWNAYINVWPGEKIKLNDLENTINLILERFNDETLFTNMETLAKKLAEDFNSILKNPKYNTPIHISVDELEDKTPVKFKLTNNDYSINSREIDKDFCDMLINEYEQYLAVDNYSGLLEQLNIDGKNNNYSKNYPSISKRELLSDYMYLYYFFSAFLGVNINEINNNLVNKPWGLSTYNIPDNVTYICNGDNKAWLPIHDGLGYPYINIWVTDHLLANKFFYNYSNGSKLYLDITGTIPSKFQFSGVMLFNPVDGKTPFTVNPFEKELYIKKLRIIEFE